jgi:hypothetical protein
VTEGWVIVATDYAFDGVDRLLAKGLRPTKQMTNLRWQWQRCPLHQAKLSRDRATSVF